MGKKLSSEPILSRISRIASGSEEEEEEVLGDAITNDLKDPEPGGGRVLCDCRDDCVAHNGGRLTRRRRVDGTGCAVCAVPLSSILVPLPLYAGLERV